MRAKSAVLAAALAALGPVPALAHGGCYRHAPGPDAPPGSPGPAGASPLPTGDPLGGPSVGRGPGGVKATAWTEWPRWWGCNQDALLALRATQRRMRVSSHAGPDPAAVVLVSPDTIRTRIAPALRALVGDATQNADIRSAAVLGVAKCGDPAIGAELRRLLVDAEGTVHRTVRESAALGLGLLGEASDETVDVLAACLRAPDAGFVRPFSAIALGLLGGPRAAPELLGVLSCEEPGQDVKPACLLALGALGDEATIPSLVAMVRAGRAAPDAAALTDIERSFAVGALGMIGRSGADDAALDAVLDLVRRRHDAPGLDVRRSAVIALGRMAAASEGRRRSVELLRDLADDGGADELERGFALISLGRIAAASADRVRLRDDVVAQLVTLLHSRRGQVPAFAAVSLGLVGQAISADGGPPPERDIRAPLRNAFAGESIARLRGSFALAAGLTRDPFAADPLLAVLRDEHADRGLRGWCALGLGLIGDYRAAEPLRTVLRDCADRELRVQCATAAGLLGDGSMQTELVGILRDDDSSCYELGSAAIALGRIGDERCVEPLVEIATDATGRWPDLTRGLAAAALGRLADRGDVPVLARITTDLNYRAHVRAIAELLTIL